MFGDNFVATIFVEQLTRPTTTAATPENETRSKAHTISDRLIKKQNQNKKNKNLLKKMQRRLHALNA